MMKVMKEDSHLKFNSASCGNFNLMGFSTFTESERPLILTKITPTVKSIKKSKNNKNSNDLKDNNILEIKYDTSVQSNTATTTTANSTTNKDLQKLFSSKSLNDMKHISQGTKNLQQFPAKDKMLTIEEFYRQTPEYFSHGRVSRLSHAFEEVGQNFEPFRLEDSSDSDYEEIKQIKAQEAHQVTPPNQRPQSNSLPHVAQQLQDREKNKNKTGILKPSKTMTPQTVKIEINDSKLPSSSKMIPTSNINVPRKISTNKLLRIAELNAQNLDVELNHRLNSAKDKSILANQQATHSDSVRLSYLKRYVANGLSGKNGSKFCNGYWNRLPVKTKPLTLYEYAGSNETVTTMLTKTSIDASNTTTSTTTTNLTRPSKLSTSSIHQSNTSNLSQTSNGLQKELTIIDLHLPVNNNTNNNNSSLNGSINLNNRNYSQTKAPIPYYKRNLFVYLNKANSVSNGSDGSGASPLGNTSLIRTNAINNSISNGPSVSVIPLNGKSVTFNNTVENYHFEHSDETANHQHHNPNLNANYQHHQQQHQQQQQHYQSSDARSVYSVGSATTTTATDQIPAHQATSTVIPNYLYDQAHVVAQPSVNPSPTILTQNKVSFKYFNNPYVQQARPNKHKTSIDFKRNQLSTITDEYQNNPKSGLHVNSPNDFNINGNSSNTNTNININNNNNNNINSTINNYVNPLNTFNYGLQSRRIKFA